MTPALASLFSLIDQYGYVMLSALSVLEGPIVSVIAGFILAQGALSVIPVFIILLVGDLCGDLFWYGVGYYGSRHHRVYEWMSVNADRVEAFSKRLRNNLGKTIFIAKYTQTGIIAMPAAGVAHMPIGPFLFYNLLASIPKTALLLLTGYFFGYALTAIDTGLRIGSMVLGVAALTFVLWYYYRHVRPEHAKG